MTQVHEHVVFRRPGNRVAKAALGWLPGDRLLIGFADDPIVVVVDIHRPHEILASFDVDGTGVALLVGIDDNHFWCATVDSVLQRWDLRAHAITTWLATSRPNGLRMRATGALLVWDNYSVSHWHAPLEHGVPTVWRTKDWLLACDWVSDDELAAVFLSQLCRFSLTSGEVRDLGRVAEDYDHPRAACPGPIPGSFYRLGYRSEYDYWYSTMSLVGPGPGDWRYESGCDEWTTPDSSVVVAMEPVGRGCVVVTVNEAKENESIHFRGDGMPEEPDTDEPQGRGYADTACVSPDLRWVALADAAGVVVVMRLESRVPPLP